MYKPIILQGLSLSFSGKHCFADFSTHIYSGSRIAIIGRNGSGKSTLLNLICQKLEPSNGQIIIPAGLCIGYVEQTINTMGSLSGGQRFNKKLSEVLSQSPDVLILDEPCNGLDDFNRQKALKLIDILANAGTSTILYVNHNVEERIPSIHHMLNMQDYNV